VLFGLGPKAPAELAVRVIWPNGVEERFAGLATGRYHQLRQGGGSESPP